MSTHAMDVLMDIIIDSVRKGLSVEEVLHKVFPGEELNPTLVFLVKKIVNQTKGKEVKA